MNNILEQVLRGPFHLNSKRERVESRKFCGNKVRLRTGLEKDAILRLLESLKLFSNK